MSELSDIADTLETLDWPDTYARGTAYGPMSRAGEPYAIFTLRRVFTDGSYERWEIDDLTINRRQADGMPGAINLELDILFKANRKTISVDSRTFRRGMVVLHLLRFPFRDHDWPVLGTWQAEPKP